MSMGRGNHRCQQLFVAGRAVLALHFPPLKMAENPQKHQTPVLTYLPSSLYWQIKLTSWVSRGRGDFVLSQIIFVFFFLPLDFLALVFSMLFLIA